MSKKVVIGLFFSMLLLLIGAAYFALARRAIIRSYLVRWSDLEEISPNLYVDPQMPETQRLFLLINLADSKERIRSLYGEYTADPLLIAGHTMDVMKDYGGNSYNRTGRTYLTPVATIVVLGPDGVVSRDVLSHELAHAEFVNRIGYRHKDAIPSWFDEGLAVQFDYRFPDSDGRFGSANGEAAFELDQLGTIEYDDWLGYAKSKQEVGRWLEVVGEEGFRDFLQAIRSGDNFHGTYRLIEQTYSAAP